LDFHRSAQEVYHLYQGFTPWPGIYTSYNGKKFIIEKCYYLPEHTSSSDDKKEKIGAIIQLENKSIGVVCGK
jgi:methionyl-tRNA formyltransferase